MKLTLLFFFTVAVLFQSGCATRPSIDEQTLQEQRDDQAAKKSDAFAKGLQQ
jgi:hypothetical protein